MTLAVNSATLATGRLVRANPVAKLAAAFSLASAYR